MPTKVVRTKTTLGPRGRNVTIDDAVVDVGEVPSLSFPALVVQIHPSSISQLPNNPTGQMASTVVDPTSLAMRVSEKPAEYGTGGHFKFANVWPEAAGGSAGPILSLRWTSSDAVMVITKIVWTHAILQTAFSAQQYIDLGCWVARSFSASDTGGDSMLTDLTNSNKARTSMANSLIGSLRIGADTNIVAGTRTLDQLPFCQACADVASNTVATGGTPLLTSSKVMYQPLPGGDYPVVLAQNEGLIIAPVNPFGSTGVVKFGIQLEWLESPSY